MLAIGVRACEKARRDPALAVVVAHGVVVRTPLWSKSVFAFEHDLFGRGASVSGNDDSAIGIRVVEREGQRRARRHRARVHVLQKVHRVGIPVEEGPSPRARFAEAIFAEAVFAEPVHGEAVAEAVFAEPFSPRPFSPSPFMVRPFSPRPFSPSLLVPMTLALV